VDGGLGALGALGMRFYDAHGKELKPHGNSACGSVSKIDPSSFISKCGKSLISFACDVDSPLLGERGAANLFGPQKMSPEMREDKNTEKEYICRLESGLKSLTKAMLKAGGRDVANMNGVGAAGGFPLGFCSFLGSKLENGADLILRSLHFDQFIGCDAAFTCEGFCGSQTLRGKGPFAVCKWLKGSYIVVLCGGLQDEFVEQEMLKAGASLVLPIGDAPCSLEESIARTEHLLRRAAARGFYAFLSSSVAIAPTRN
jgi:glycerate kinase